MFVLTAIRVMPCWPLGNFDVAICLPEVSS